MAVAVVAAAKWSLYALAECGDGRDEICRLSHVQDKHSSVRQRSAARL